MSIFKQQAAFIAAMGQDGDPDLYSDLVCEEFVETLDAYEVYRVNPTPEHLANVIDGCIDLIYVTAGMVNSLGVDGDAAFAEVHRSNMSKMGPDGKAIRRDDGKILKPETFSPPDLLAVVLSSLEKKEAA